MRRYLMLCFPMLAAHGTMAKAQGTPPPWVPSQMSAVPARAPDDTAEVYDKEIRIAIPRRVLFDRADAWSEVGYYAWRIAVDAPEPFTIVLMADTVMRSADLRQIVRASTLRMCPSAAPASLLDCTAPIKAKADVQDGAIRLIINDKEFVERIRRERPMSYARSRIEPRGRVQMVQKFWRYKDEKPKK